MIPKELIEKVKKEVDIVKIVSEYVELKKSGNNLRGLCPFHKEKTPSFIVSPDKGIYKCFGCGKGGNVINFIQNIERKSFPDTINYLALRHKLIKSEQIGTIYVLKLIEGKYYVGFSTDLDKRLESHFKGEGTAWTKKHKPLKLIETFNNSPIELENEITERYMRKFGYQNVRGGDYAFRKLPYNYTPKNFQKKKNDGVYLLELENNKYFVGFGLNMQSSIDKHFSGNGCAWTKTYKPLRVLKRVKTLNPETHKQMTLVTMAEFGWENVRGYRWIELEIQRPKELI